MKLNRKIVSAIIAIIAIAVVGIIYLQAYLLHHAFQLEKQTFRHNVNAALGSIVQKLETQEAVTKVLKVTLKKNATEPTIAVVQTAADLTNLTFDQNENCWSAPQDQSTIRIDSSGVIISTKQKQHLKLQVVDSSGQEIARLIDEVKPAGRHTIALHDSLQSKEPLYFRLCADSAFYVIRMAKTTKSEPIDKIDLSMNKRRLVEQVLRDLSNDLPQSIMKRIQPAFLDSIVQVTVAEHGLHQPYAYAILSSPKDSIILTNADQWKKELVHSSYRTALFPHDILIKDRHELGLYFPNQRLDFYRQSGLLVLTSFIFIVMIVCCFIYVLKTIFRQKEFSNRIIDFINNMTHEFKTPISTISLASETIKNPAVYHNQSKLLKYGDIILGESGRMRNQVEKILQMAALEGEEVALQFRAVDVHELVEKAVENFTLQIEKSKGKLTTQLNASSHIMEADALHLGNIIHNLLDNAVKYTKKTPHILIKTENEDHRLKISIQDNGIGLRPEEQKKIFDKYYRVPTGNIHDVKGFGLGLSYVKLMVMLHNGQVRLKSTYGKGSIFEIVLPLKQK